MTSDDHVSAPTRFVEANGTRYAADRACIRRGPMSYGHAERNLALIRQLEAETGQLLGKLIHPDQEQLAEPACPSRDLTTDTRQ